MRLPALNSKASGIAVAAVAAGIIVLWKKKLDELSSKRLDYRIVRAIQSCEPWLVRH